MIKQIYKFAFLTFGLFILPAFISPVSAQTLSEVFIVADRRADCAGAAMTKCLQIKRPQEEKWSLFYQPIENFNYIEGYTYIVRVRTNQVKNPPADVSNVKYRLQKILYREKTGVGNSTENNSADASALTANSWKLTAIDGAAVSAEKAFIKFDETKKSAGGNGGCNVFGGSYARNGNQIKISEVFSTKMFCEATSEIENKFLGSLEKVTRYTASGGELFLYAGDKIVLEFAAQN